ncbi:hypothetical protein SDC9_212590 [bioreactor metagenome]|uniref:Uncharacterized protein n=1 Tax=bioreactor metagenome TaxID=1076179 RepID=A0A645K104_9ZZZZ
MGKVARQESEAFAGFHYRAGEDDLLLAPCQNIRQRLGDSKESLAGAGRPDAEDDLLLAHQADELSLTHALWIHGLAGNGDRGGRFHSF